MARYLILIFVAIILICCNKSVKIEKQNIKNDAMEKILKDVNKKKNSKLLIEAVKNDDIDVVKNLINDGCDIETKDDYDYTALLWACRDEGKNSFEIVKYLISKSADINVKDNSGTTCLMHASCTGNLDIVKILVEKGVDINIKDNKGLTALSKALYCSDHGMPNSEAIKYLKSIGAKE